MCQTGDDPEVLAEHTFTITLARGAQGDSVIISDGKDRKGGQARGRNGSGGAFVVQWQNGTDSPCRLSFYQWTVDRYGEPVEIPDWPFTSQPDGYKEPNLLHIVAGQNRSVRLQRVNQRTIIKYEVLVGAEDDPVATLDPMIVVER